MVETTGWRPCGGAVAITATITAQHMIGRLGAGQNTGSGRMASHAGSGCALENTVHMTGFATHLTMLAGQIEAGGQVIELPHHICVRCSAGLCPLCLRYVELYATQQCQTDKPAQ